MDWRQRLIAEREEYSRALSEQRALPGQNWPASQTHYLDRIEQINRILAAGDGGQGAFPNGRVSRAV
jgi:hypothetical protein